jgi:hypothetical protein
MFEKEINIGKLKILGQKCDERDNTDLYSFFNSWLSFKNLSKKFRQRANLPESLTELIVTKHSSEIYRKIKVLKPAKGVKTKFDCYDEAEKKFVEVKGCSVSNDLTSFSPKPYFDYFCLVDFSSLDGKYKVYRININSEEIMNIKVNSTETFRDQAEKSSSGGKRRPHFSIYETFINKKKYCEGSPTFEGSLIN